MKKNENSKSFWKRRKWYQKFIFVFLGIFLACIFALVALVGAMEYDRQANKKTDITQINALKPRRVDNSTVTTRKKIQGVSGLRILYKKNDSFE